MALEKFPFPVNIINMQTNNKSKEIFKISTCFNVTKMKISLSTEKSRITGGRPSVDGSSPHRWVGQALYRDV